MKKEIKFTIFLTSEVSKTVKHEDGTRTPIAISNANEFFTKMKKSLKDKNKIVLITYDANDYESNDLQSKNLFTSCKLSGLNFKEKYLLDSRNYKEAQQILSGASLIWLAGGKPTIQKRFLEKINFKKFLNDFEGVVVGVSAGAMNLCNQFVNFPEEVDDLGQKKIVKGLGFFDEFFIPHCDGKSYLYEIDGFPTFKDYILPFSFKHDLVCVPNDSYILLDKNGYKFYGDSYLLRKGEVYKKLD